LLLRKRNLQKPAFCRPSVFISHWGASEAPRSRHWSGGDRAEPQEERKLGKTMKEDRKHYRKRNKRVKQTKHNEQKEDEENKRKGKR
jgi:hypothetical protein